MRCNMSVVHSILAVMPWSLHISVRCAALTLLWLINNYVGAQDALIPGVSVVTGVNSTLVDDELWSDLEKGAFSYSIYVHVDKPISSRIMFEVGLGLARKRYRITNDNLQWPAQVDSNFLFDPTIMPGGPDDIVRFQYSLYISADSIEFALYVIIDQRILFECWRITNDSYGQRVYGSTKDHGCCIGTEISNTK